MGLRGLGTALNKLRVFVDADVIFAGSASPTTQGASHIILVMGELTLIECITSEQAVIEVERNLSAKLPEKLLEFQLLVSRALRIVSDPAPAQLHACAGQADPKDLPLLAVALREACPYFVTFNIRHYFPIGETIKVLRPGDLLLTIRQTLGQL